MRSRDLYHPPASPSSPSKAWLWPVKESTGRPTGRTARILHARPLIDGWSNPIAFFGRSLPSVTSLQPLLGVFHGFYSQMAYWVGLIYDRPITSTRKKWNFTCLFPHLWVIWWKNLKLDLFLCRYALWQQRQTLWRIVISVVPPDTVWTSAFREFKLCKPPWLVRSKSSAKTQDVHYSFTIILWSIAGGDISHNWAIIHVKDGITVVRHFLPGQTLAWSLSPPKSLATM